MSDAAIRKITHVDMDAFYASVEQRDDPSLHGCPGAVGYCPNLFGDHPRVNYRQAPLMAVICQIRYPALLKVDAEPPAAFQEEIRDRFPLYETGGNKVGGEIPAEFAKLLAPHLSRVAHIFKTEDEKSKITLGADSVSLSRAAAEL